MNDLGEYKGFSLFFNPEKRNFVATQKGLRLEGVSYSSLCRKINGGRRGDIIFMYDEKLKGEEVTIWAGNGGAYNAHLTGTFYKNSYAVYVDVITLSGKEESVYFNNIYKTHFADRLNVFEKERGLLANKIDELRRTNKMSDHFIKSRT